MEYVNTFDSRHRRKQDDGRGAKLERGQVERSEKQLGNHFARNKNVKLRNWAQTKKCVRACATVSVTTWTASGRLSNASSACSFLYRLFSLSHFDFNQWHYRLQCIANARYEIHVKQLEHTNKQINTAGARRKEFVIGEVRDTHTPKPSTLIDGQLRADAVCHALCLM